VGNYSCLTPSLFPSSRPPFDASPDLSTRCDLRHFFPIPLCSLRFAGPSRLPFNHVCGLLPRISPLKPLFPVPVSLHLSELVRYRSRGVSLLLSPPLTFSTGHFFLKVDISLSLHFLFFVCVDSSFCPFPGCAVPRLRSSEQLTASRSVPSATPFVGDSASFVFVSFLEIF